MEIIQVSANSPTSAVAQAISSVIHEYQCAEVQAIGAEAVNQAMQAIILASTYLRHEGISVSFVPQRKKITIDNKNQTLIKLMVVSSTTSSLFPMASSTASNRSGLPRV